MNVSDVSAFRECTSCQVCASVCSRQAISIELDNDGFYRPIVNSERCINCGLCTTVCYKFDKNILVTTDNTLSDKKIYSAWAKDDEILANTTSGGLGDLLARELMHLGYHVVGVVYNIQKEIAEHKIAETNNELEKFRGSKYIQSYTFDAFKEVLAHCREEKYAVFGTPCQIYALHKYTAKKNIRNNLFLIDFYCHGCPSMYVWHKYIKYAKSKCGQEDIDKVLFRSKVRGWGQFYVSFFFKEKIVYSSSPKDNAFYELFFSDMLLNKACEDCLLRSTLDYSDIRLGDFWGKRYLWNKKGVSGVSVVSERGKEIFERIKQNIVYQECKYSEFLPYQSWGRTYQNNTKNRLAIMTILKDPTLNIDDVVEKYHKQQSAREHVVRYTKIILSYLPNWITTILKKIR